MRYGHGVQIPDTLRSSVLQRVRRMDRAARGVLMLAAVIGRRFPVALLAATASCPETRVRAALESACELQLIAAEDSAGEVYLFRHALTRDIIYAELVSLRMRPFHRNIARALERARSGGDVPLEDLAYHSWAAADATRALRYNELAGDNAAAVHAHDNARAYYLRALSLLEVDSTAYERVRKKLLDVIEAHPRLGAEAAEGE